MDIVYKLALNFYIVSSFLWAVCSVLYGIRLGYPKSWNLVYTFILNLLLMPVAMLFAIYWLATGHTVWGKREN